MNAAVPCAEPGVSVFEARLSTDADLIWLARTARRMSLVDVTIHWWTRYVLAWSSAATIRRVLADRCPSEELMIWTADTLYLLLRQRIDEHSDGRITARLWTILALGDTPGVVAACGDSAWVQAHSLHPLHAAQVTRDRQRAVLHTERQRLEQQQQHILHAGRRLEQPVTKTHTVPDLEAALRGQRRWSAALRGALTPEQIEQVRAPLRAAYRDQLSRVQARLGALQSARAQLNRHTFVPRKLAHPTSCACIVHQEDTMQPHPFDEATRQTVHHALLTHLTPLAIPVPPSTILERALQYPGSVRFVAFYYAGSKGRYADGRGDAEVITEALLFLLAHPAIGPHLCGFDFGSDDRPARHALVLDRQARTWSVAPLNLAMRLVGTQDRSVQIEVGYTPSGPYAEAFVALSQPEQHRIISERIQQREQANHVLAGWLDAQPVTLPDTTNPADWTITESYGMLSIAFRGTPIGFAHGETPHLWGGYTVFEEPATAALQCYQAQPARADAPDACREA